MDRIAVFAFEITMPAHSLTATYRAILREVNKQYVRRNGNQFWSAQVKAGFRKGAAATDTAEVHARRRDAENLLTYLQSNREYKELMERYWPSSSLTPQEKIERTANRVGLTAPKPISFLMDKDDTPRAAA
ncbi:hypothetical protein HK105_206665 [Polyrhizophydium stewartii]|uniref:Uncharacterized protein n=1 Tax=Polyrhizophydium stewartii TaxID=2732419 RepID=A0ABR4N2U7_9FUNG